MLEIENGFNKINLSLAKPSQPRERVSPRLTREEVNPNRRKRNFRLRKVFIFFLFLLFILIGTGAAIFLPAKGLVGKSKQTIASARELAGAIKNQDLSQAEVKLSETKRRLAETKKAASYLGFIKYLPLVGVYYQDFGHGLTAAEAGLEALDISIVAIEPYADLLGLKGESTFVAGSANERIQMGITTFEKVTPRLGEISEQLETVQKEIMAIDPNRYPEKIGDQEIRGKLTQARSLIDKMATLFFSARPLLEELPKIMGHPQPKTYLVFFKNDKELRPDGGFITAYAIFRFESGKPIVEKADDIYKLDETMKKKVAAPAEILKYHQKVYEFHLRDSNLSPDFVESIKLFEQLYQNIPNQVDYDGVVTVDTHVLVEAMRILGTFVVAGRTFNAETDPRCDCPRAVYELEDYATRPVAYVREGRKDIIGVLLLQIMQTALGVSPSQYWGQLFQMGINELNEKHILVYFEDEKTQKAIEFLGWGGRIRDFTGDYLHINDANMAGAKSDLFVKRSATVEYNLERDGLITKTLTIDYKNPAQPSNCSLESGQLCLNGLLRDWVRIYVPRGSKLLEFKGSEMDPVVKEDLGKTVFEGFLTVKPLGASQIVVKYSLPVELAKGEKLPVLIQKQPGTQGHQYEIMVNGKMVEQFVLQTDKEFSLTL